MASMHLTDKKLRGLQAGPNVKGRHHEIWDSSFRGGSFGVRVAVKTGSKHFMLLYRVNGKRRRITLGNYPLVSLADARSRARALVAEAEAGKDPGKERRDYRTAPTFGDVASQFLNTPRTSQLSPRTRHEYRRILDKDLLPAWGEVKAVDVKKKDVAELLDQVLERGSEIMANRTRALISVIFNFAIEREIVEYSPVTGVRRPAAERTRDRVLSQEEVRTLWEALELEHLTISGLFRFLLLTAQRNEETRLTRWEHLEDGIWRIPAENTKNGRAHSVALSSQALAVLEPLRNGKSPWVFASPSSRSKGPILWVSHACIRLKKRCGFDFRPHDLRRTATSGMAALGTVARDAEQDPQPQVGGRFGDGHL